MSGVTAAPTASDGHSRTLSLATLATIVSIAVALPVMGNAAISIPVVLAGFPVAAATAIDLGVATYRGALLAVTAAIAYFATLGFLNWPDILRRPARATSGSTAPSDPRGSASASTTPAKWIRSQRARDGGWGRRSLAALAVVLATVVGLVALLALAAVALASWARVFPVAMVPVALVGVFVGARWGNTPSGTAEVARHAVGLVTLFALAVVVGAALSPVVLRSSEVRLDDRTGLPSGRYVVVGSNSTWTYLGTCGSAEVKTVATSLVLTVTEVGPSVPTAMHGRTLGDILTGRVAMLVVCDSQEFEHLR